MDKEFVREIINQLQSDIYSWQDRIAECKRVIADCEKCIEQNEFIIKKLRDEK